MTKQDAMRLDSTYVMSYDSIRLAPISTGVEIMTWKKTYLSGARLSRRHRTPPQSRPNLDGGRNYDLEKNLLPAPISMGVEIMTWKKTYLSGVRLSRRHRTPPQSRPNLDGGRNYDLEKNLLPAPIVMGVEIMTRKKTYLSGVRLSRRHRTPPQSRPNLDGGRNYDLEKNLLTYVAFYDSTRCASRHPIPGAVTVPPLTSMAASTMIQQKHTAVKRDLKTSLDAMQEATEKTLAANGNTMSSLTPATSCKRRKKCSEKDEEDSSGKEPGPSRPVRPLKQPKTNPEAANKPMKLYPMFRNTGAGSTDVPNAGAAAVNVPAVPLSIPSPPPCRVSFINTNASCKKRGREIIEFEEACVHAFVQDMDEFKNNKDSKITLARTLIDL
ncbi:hypothetical protein C8R44DRAFT_736183 [Mycena epipterygia]|nr:hypothetical protein C8R44DRAFT_736183 [Mycena epipterygia]